MADVLTQYQVRWQDYKRIFSSDVPVEKLETDLFAREVWGKSLELAQLQLEEVFCDLVGIIIFGRSFLYSFEFLVAPNLGRYRDYEYPPIRERARFMVEFASRYGINDMIGFEKQFNEDKEQRTEADEFVISIADEVTRALHTKLPHFVVNYLGQAEPFTTGSVDEKGVEECLIALVPSATVKSIAAIVNAGWKVRLEIESWDILREINDDASRRAQKLRVLNDLILKSLEVYEFNKRIENAS